MESLDLWPLVIYFAAVILLILVMLGLSYLLGQQHRERATAEPFESGIVPVGYARFRLSAKFYLVAMFFVIFDLEAVFIFAWAIAFREVGWAGYIEVLIFIGILIAALVYLWRLGALDWAPEERRRNPINPPLSKKRTGEAQISPHFLTPSPLQGEGRDGGRDPGWPS